MKAELISYSGDDLTVVNSARVSFDKESIWEKDIPATGLKELKESDVKLINYLSKHNHFTPFTHCSITLREEVPIFVARQRFKHMVGFSYNEVSRRYIDSPPQFYEPTEWRRRASNAKQGSSNETVNIDTGSYMNEYQKALKTCEWTYNHLLRLGVCPEQARMVLPQSMYTSYYVTGSLYAFARAYNLRSDPHAQKEIQYLASLWDKIIKVLYPASWNALTNKEKEQ
jgi:thymidylate synthase (FAD)|tara:strand:- start:385 stop:1065 length:681 start_codon:yes stop_codon:yes gene_type:complete